MAPANLTFNRAKDIVFAHNTFIHLGAVGLSLENGSKDSTILGNHFTDISSTGVGVGDVDKPNTTDEREITRNIQVNNNYIHDVAVEYQGSVGVWFGYVQNSTVANNLIYGLPYTGISIGWGHGKPDPSVAKDNKVQNNLIYNHMLVLEDGGGVYSLGAQPGNVYSGNVILNQVHRHGGLYLDNGSRYITAYDNIIYNSYGSVLLNDTGDNFLHDNYWQDRGTMPDGNPDIWIRQRVGFGPNILQNNHPINSLNEAPAKIITAAGPRPQRLFPTGTISAGSYTLTWDPITGAKRYLLRIDDTVDPWVGANDVYEDNLTTNSYTLTFKSGHTYNWWVHAGYDITGTNGPAGSGSIKVVLPGDIDKNGKVDIFDYNLLVTDFGKTTPSPADIDKNGKVDIFDYNILVGNFGR